MFLPEKVYIFISVFQKTFLLSFISENVSPIFYGLMVWPWLQMKDRLLANLSNGKLLEDMSSGHAYLNHI